MSDGAMMSQPASASTSAWARSAIGGLIVDDGAAAQEAVVAVAGIGIERDVAEHADLRHRLLDRPDGAADQVVGIERFAAVLVASPGIGIGKQQAGNGERGGALGVAHGLVDRKSLHAGHGSHRHAFGAVDQEQRPDQVVRGQHVLAHEAPRPLGLAMRRGRVVRSSRCAGLLSDLGLDRRETGFDRTAVLDGHAGSRRWRPFSRSGNARQRRCLILIGCVLPH